MRYVSFAFYSDQCDTEISHIEFFDTDMSKTKVRDVLLAADKARYKDENPRWMEPEPVNEVYQKIGKNSFVKRVCGYHVGEHSCVIVAQEGDEVWNRVVPHVDIKNKVPSSVAEDFWEFIAYS